MEGRACGNEDDADDGNLETRARVVDDGDWDMNCSKAVRTQLKGKSKAPAPSLTQIQSLSRAWTHRSEHAVMTQ